MITSIKIIVPTLNTYLILPKLINSLKIQTWKDWNLLFVDGDSTKKHFNWIENSCLSDSRLKLIKQFNSKNNLEFQSLVSDIRKKNIENIQNIENKFKSLQLERSKFIKRFKAYTS